MPQFDMDSLLLAWQDAVFALYLKEDKIEPEVVENMRSWEYSGFSIDQSVLLQAGDQAGIERLVQYMVRCPFSLSRLVKVTDTGQVVYKAEKDGCQAFPDPRRDDLASGAKRNFQILDPLDFLAEFTQHRPSLRSGARPKGSHTIRYMGWYSSKSRGLRKKAEAEATSTELSSPSGTSTVTPVRSSKTWAMLIKRVYEIDPMVCSQCGGEMKIVSFLAQPQEAVIEKILRHCGLWKASAPRGPPDVKGLVHDLDHEYVDYGAELTFIEMDTFLSTF